MIEQVDCNARLCRNKTYINTRGKVIYAKKAIVLRDTQPPDCKRHSGWLVACMEWEIYNSLVFLFSQWSHVFDRFDGPTDWMNKPVAGESSSVASIPLVYRESGWKDWYISWIRNASGSSASMVKLGARDYEQCFTSCRATKLCIMKDEWWSSLRRLVRYRDQWVEMGNLWWFRGGPWPICDKPSKPLLWIKTRTTKTTTEVRWLQDSCNCIVFAKCHVRMSRCVCFVKLCRLR